MAKGRPKGSENRDYAQAIGDGTTRCPACNCTDRTDYEGSPTVVEANGTDPDGKPYDKVTIRRTMCLGCGQHRLDRAYSLSAESLAR
jgi:nitrate reductase cytochrome c-type subunit